MERDWSGSLNNALPLCSISWELISLKLRRKAPAFAKPIHTISSQPSTSTLASQGEEGYRDLLASSCLALPQVQPRSSKDPGINLQPESSAPELLLASCPPQLGRALVTRTQVAHGPTCICRYNPGGFVLKGTLATFRWMAACQTLEGGRAGGVGHPPASPHPATLKSFAFAAWKSWAPMHCFLAEVIRVSGSGKQIRAQSTSSAGR